MTDKRVLIISHNSFSKNTNMGKTLKSYFCTWNNDISQLYFHSEIPNDDTCKNYYCFTDVDALCSVFNRNRKGVVYKEKDIRLKANDTRIDTGNLRKVYEYGRHRKPVVCLLRDFIWLISKWNNKQLQLWLEQTNPEFIFLAAGDYAFPYRIALKIAKMRNIPIVTCCFDDYFINYQHKGEFLRNTFYHHFMKVAKKTIKKSVVTFATNPKMAEAYSLYFGNKWPVLYTSTERIVDKIDYSNRKGISYLGNLGYNRYLQLIKMGRVLKQMKSDYLPAWIDVYSNETNKEKLDQLVEENGIRFHGAIPQSKVHDVVSQSMAIIHTESFDNENRKMTQYSLSTKIADCLGSGTPLIAYGPSEIASMDYLIKNKSAIVATSDNDLEQVFNSLKNHENCLMVIQKQLNLAKQNHSVNAVTSFLKSTIYQKIDKIM